MMWNKRISDMLDAMQDDTVPLSEAGACSAAQVQTLTLAKVRGEAAARCPRRRPVWGKLLAVAAAAAVLTTTGLAVNASPIGKIFLRHSALRSTARLCSAPTRCAAPPVRIKSASEVPAGSAACFRQGSASFRPPSTSKNGGAGRSGGVPSAASHTRRRSRAWG